MLIFKIGTSFKFEQILNRNKFCIGTNLKLEQISYQKKIQLEQILNKKNSNHKKF
jgi:hypothetical protein